MSALPPKVDINRDARDVCFVPIADMRGGYSARANDLWRSSLKDCWTTSHAPLQGEAGHDRCKIENPNRPRGEDNAKWKDECPLWVISGHCVMSASCLLYP